ncbi:MAG: HAD-IA family hydrolase [Actinomycetota bacterium]
MPTSKACRAVFFDVGETLLSPHPSFPDLFARVLIERGHRVQVSAVEEVFARMAPTFAEVIDKHATEPWTVSRESSLKFWGRIYRVALGELGIGDTDGEIARAMYSKFTRYESYRLFPDVLPVLQTAKQAGLTLGLISNFEEWLEGLLTHMEVAELFDPVVISGKVGIEKPDPAIFRLALDQSGADAAESVYVGDHPRIDVKGAEAVGMGAVLIDRKGRHTGFEGHRISTLDQLLPLLDTT